MSTTLNKSQRAALAAIVASRNSVISLPELAEIVGSHPNGVSRTVGSLITRELVERVRTDGRVGYRATVHGRDAARKRTRRQRICLACARPERYQHHTCGLKDLQSMLRIG
jgi:DNA-binding MarR family transcriptional regulator